MAQGEAQRPLETVDGQPVDTALVGGDKSLLTADRASQALLREIITNQQELLLYLKGSYILNALPSSNMPINSAQALAVREVRGPMVPLAPTAATIGTSSVVALKANIDRKGLVLVNTSANTISLGLGTDALLNSGITLTPSASWNMTEADFTLGPISAIASAGSSNLAIQEFV